MKQPLLSTVIIVASLCPAILRPARAQDAPPARNTPLIAMIDNFFAHPFREAGRAALFDSAEARSDVMIRITSAVTPSLCYADDGVGIRALDALLLTAYVAGNMREQLVQGRASDQVEAGMRSVLAVYDTVRSRVSDYRVPEVDRWRDALTGDDFAGFARRVAQDQRECNRSRRRYPRGADLTTSTP